MLLLSLSAFVSVPDVGCLFVVCWLQCRFLETFLFRLGRGGHFGFLQETEALSSSAVSSKRCCSGWVGPVTMGFYKKRRPKRTGGCLFFFLRFAYNARTRGSGRGREEVEKIGGNRPRMYTAVLQMKRSSCSCVWACEVFHTSGQTDHLQINHDLQ